jgi:hypothetical protein
MKTKLLAFVALTAAATTFAAPLTAPTAVHTKPDEKSPTVTVLNAGTEPAMPKGATLTPPAGWMAIDLPGPHTAYVQNKDLLKNLDVTPGAPIYLEPKADAGVLTIAERADKTEINGVINSKWSRIVLNKNLVGYIKAVPASAVAPAPVIAPAPTTPPAPAPISPSPVAPVAYGTSTTGQAVPIINMGDGGSQSLPRSFQGRFVSTRRAFTPRRPYDWALNDESGRRYAYLDISQLLQTEQIEKYTDHVVLIYGTARATPDGKDILIQVESLQLK